MNKRIFFSIASILLLSSCAQSQWFGRTRGNGNVITETRNVGSYDEIYVAGAFDVTLIYGKEGKLAIKIEDNLLEYLVTEVKGNTLKIKWEKGINISTRKGVYITVPFKDLDAVRLSGSGDIISDDTIKSSDFYTSVSGSGDIKLTVDADDIISKVTGSGDVTIFGSTNHLKTSVTGSGDFHGYQLSAQDVDAKVTGSGDVSVQVSKKLNARITGSGDIDYKGNPEFVDTKVTGSGDITAK